jgi:hypothetical protein
VGVAPGEAGQVLLTLWRLVISALGFLRADRPVLPNLSRPEQLPAVLAGRRHFRSVAHLLTPSPRFRDDLGVWNLTEIPHELLRGSQVYNSVSHCLHDSRDGRCKQRESREPVEPVETAAATVARVAKDVGIRG